MAVLQMGQPVPQLALKDQYGNCVRLDDFQGRMLLVNFWSAECPLAERADLCVLPWQDRVALVWIASNSNEPPELLANVAAERRLPILLLDPDQRAAEAFGALTTPHFFLFDAQGLLRYQGAPDDLTFRRRTPLRHYVVEAMEALVAGAPVPIEETPPYGCTIVRNLP